MTKRQTTARQYVRLTFEDGEVVVTPKDRDVFLISAEKATHACQEAIRDDERVKRFESELLVPIHVWCQNHNSKIKACFIPLPRNHVQVFMVTTCHRFDLDLAEEVAGLELSLGRSGWRVGVSQLPDADEESLATFFRPEGALQVYAKQGPAPNKSGK
jgi:hypothetical protein